MSRSKTTLDLVFGADVEALGALHMPTFRDSDGRTFEFNAILAPHTPKLPSLLATAMSLIQSKNDRAFSRKNTNSTLFRSLAQFLDWADAQPLNILNSEGLTAFRSALFDRVAATTAYGVYTVVARSCSALIDAGHLSRFPIPENASRNRVAASASNSGASFATAFDGAMDHRGADEANESIMKAWLNAAWTELDALFARIAQGRAWRGEVIEGWRLPANLEAYLQFMALSRQEALSICKTICLTHLNGKSPSVITVSKSDATSSWVRSIQAIGAHFGSGKEPGITPIELQAAIVNPEIDLVAIPSWARSPPLEYAGDKLNHVKLIVQCLDRHFSGFPFESSMGKRFPDLPQNTWLRAVQFLLSHANAMGHKIYTPEIASYFHPSPAMAGIAMSILCAAQINPTSVMHLKTGDLVDDPDTPEQARLSWEKGRAGGPQSAIPFPKGATLKSRTIPRLWERLLDASAELRALAPVEAKNKLFIWTTGETGKGWISFPTDHGGDGGMWRMVRSYLAGETIFVKPQPKTVEMLAPISAHIKKMSFALIRNTAINISSARLDRDFKSAAAMDGRKSVAVLESAYLANAQTKSRLDQQIRSGQEALANWLRTPPLVVPAEEDELRRELSVDEAMAKSLLLDELNNGMGASLLNNRAIFIDTPLNALRIIQWLEQLEESKSRLLRDNPMRWETLYSPQIKLYQEALHSFSRPSVSAAKTMAQDIQLPFPPIN